MRVLIEQQHRMVTISVARPMWKEIRFTGVANVGVRFSMHLARLARQGHIHMYIHPN